MRRLWPEAALLGVAAAFALTFAGGSVWLDEAFSVQVAESRWAWFWELLRNDNGPPLYYALLKGWIALFGDGERALRAMSAVFAVAAVAPAIALGRELGGGSRASGLATGVLFACSAQLALHARAARMYALVMLLAAVATWAWARWLRAASGTRPTVPRAARDPNGHDANARDTSAPMTTAPSGASWPLIVLALATALGAYTHYWFAFLTLGQVIAAAAILRRRAWPLLLSVAAGWLPFLAWAPTFLAQLHNGSRAWIPPLTPWAPLEALWGVLGLPATIALALLIAALWWRQRPTLDPSWRATLILLAVALLVPSALSLRHPIFFPIRHAAIAAPAIAALLGAPLSQLLPARALAPILAAVLALRAATHAAEGRASLAREPDSDRGAAAYLTSHATPGDIVICVGLSGPALRYYLRGSQLDVISFPAEMKSHPAWIDPAAFSPSTLAAEAASLDAWLRARPVWLVSVEGDPVAEPLRARLSTRPRGDSAPLSSNFFDHLDRFLPR